MAFKSAACSVIVYHITWFKHGKGKLQQFLKFIDTFSTVKQACISNQPPVRCMYDE